MPEEDAAERPRHEADRLRAEGEQNAGVRRRGGKNWPANTVAASAPHTANSYHSRTAPTTLPASVRRSLPRRGLYGIPRAIVP